MIKAVQPFSHPGPVCRQVKLCATRPCGQTSGHRDEPCPDGLCHHGTGNLKTEGADPAHHVVRDACEHHPGCVGIELSRGTVRKSCPLFEVANRELDNRVATVIFVKSN